MCVFSVAYRVWPDCPIFVLTNRDESTERPTLSPRIFESTTPKGARWFGGADQRAGGTWVGVNEHGLLVAVTNRKTTSVPANPRSRGLLCRDLLECMSVKSALDRLGNELSNHAYAGFNLILLTARRARAFVLEVADESRLHKLKPGIHTIGNGHLNASDDLRVQRMQAMVEEMVTHGGRKWADWVDQAKAICRTHAEADDPGICLHGEGWGTVGSTVVGLPLDPRQSVHHYAAGPPCRVPYVDYSTSLRELLARTASGN
ncbi:MAG TPA: NRDE family protein [Planctomycetaceae bacterium]|jgi:uncharacterized protein with NRDE domain|nr:NRDE family protein [Planctomycetaceae bacterium]